MLMAIKKKNRIFNSSIIIKIPIKGRIDEKYSKNTHSK